MTIPSDERSAPGNSIDPPAPKRLVPLFVGFLVIGFFLQHLPGLIPALRLPGTHLNWTGKILGIAFSCLALGVSPWLRHNVGLRWRQAPGSFRVSFICFLACFGLFFVLNFHRAADTFSTETMLFQIFIPSLDEELAIRGIALALLEKAFHQSPMSCQLRFGWAALITSLVFGLAHAFSSEGGQMSFNLFAFLFTTLVASILVVARIRSGSLLWPMLCHTAANTSLFFIPLMR